MDRYCPECNSTMTPSLVGYLCSNCGNMQRFYTESNPLFISHTEMPMPSGSPSPQQPPTAVDSVGSNKIRSTLKRLMVPELPPPHGYDSTATVDGISRPVTGSSPQPSNPLPSSPLSTYDHQPIPPSEVLTNKQPAPVAQSHTEFDLWLWVCITLVGLSAGALVFYFALA